MDTVDGSPGLRIEMVMEVFHCDERPDDQK